MYSTTADVLVLIKQASLSFVGKEEKNGTGDGRGSTNQNVIFVFRNPVCPKVCSFELVWLNGEEEKKVWGC